MSFVLQWNDLESLQVTFFLSSLEFSSIIMDKFVSVIFKITCFKISFKLFIQTSMTLALRKAACRAFAMQALNWLLRSVSQPACLHDLLWCFVAALESNSEENGADSESKQQAVKDKKNRKKNNQQDSPASLKDPLGLFEHPMSDISIAGDAAQPLPDTFHSLLQTVSDLMLLLPIGSSLQQVTVRVI